MLSAAALSVILFGAGHRASAQAIPAASKTADVSAFGGFSLASPDYGPTHNLGGFAGVDYTRYFHWRVAPSLEVRGTDVYGSTVNEKSLTAGLRAQTDFRYRYHPYADFLVGGGVIHYAHAPYPGYTGDRALSYSMGGGVDIDLVRHFEAKIDLQAQSWNMGANSYLKPGGGSYTLSPILLNFGIAYRFPFRPHVRQSDYR